MFLHILEICTTFLGNKKKKKKKKKLFYTGKLITTQII